MCVCSDADQLPNFHPRDAKRTLPRPKVGDFCSNAMEQGFSDACVALCMNERPVPRVAQACRAAAIEMPRPTVRRWCEHGYNTAFSKTIKDLKSHFKPEEQLVKTPEPPVSAASEPVRSAVEHTIETHNVDAEAARKEEVRANKEAVAPRESGLRGSSGSRAVKATIPITIGEDTKDLLVHEGQNAEDAVVVFCRENVPDDVSSCIRQLLPTVLEQVDQA